MSKLLESCLLCNSTDKLDTTSAKFDSKTYNVSVCSNCIDDASPKVLREALTNKLDKFKVLIENAKALGVDLTMDTLIGAGQSLVVPTASAPVPVAAPVAAPPKSKQIEQAPKMISLRDEKGNQLPATTYLVTKQKIDAPMARMNKKEGVEPLKTEIPSKIVSNSGTLHVTIRNMSSKEFDDRFKAQAHRSTQMNEDVTKFVPCHACAGEGWIKTGNNKQPTLCKECDGVGSK